MRESFFRPLGLVTVPNEYGFYPAGALSRAENVVMRDPGILSQLSKRDTFGNDPWDETEVDFHFLMLYNTSATYLALVLGDGAYTPYWYASGLWQAAPYEDTKTTFTYVGPNDPLGYIAPWNKPITFRERTLLTSDQGVLVADYIDPDEFATPPTQLNLRHAGFPQPFLWGFTYSAGTAVTGTDVVTYAATLERKYDDRPGYVLISEPSPLQRIKANGDSGFEMSVSWAGGDATVEGLSGVREGDVVKIWRSLPQTSSAPDENIESGTTLYLAKTYSLTSADITAQFTTIIDDADPDSLYEELYSNPGQQSLLSIRRRPPQAKCVAYYQGATFYANCRTAGQWKTRVPYGIGALDNGAATVRERGIGYRTGAGNFTSGSPTVTGVSAADYAGLAVGQRFYDPAGANGYTITALPGGGVITMSANYAGATLPSPFATVDVIEVDGIKHPIPDLYGFVESLGTAGNAPDHFFYNLIADNTIAYREQLGTPFSLADLQLVFNQGWALGPTRYAQNGAAISIRATNGANYDPPVPEITASPQEFASQPEPNRMYWSWDQQPECVAPGNSMPVGAGEIIALAQIRDSLIVFCTDGTYRVTGYLTRTSGIGAAWRIDALDRSFVIASASAFTVLRDRCYAVGSLGLVEVTEGSVQQLSTGVVTIDSEGPVIGLTSPHEVWIKLHESQEGWLIYSVDQEAYTQYIAEDADQDTVASESPFAGQGFINFAGSLPGVTNLGGADAVEATIDYQPVHGQNPLGAKQWIDMTLIFDVASAGRIAVPRFNGSSWPTAAAALLNRQNDSRRNYQVPRNAPALGHTLCPGIVLTGTSADPRTRMSLRGVSLRFQPLSDQQVFR